MRVTFDHGVQVPRLIIFGFTYRIRGEGGGGGVEATHS